MEEKIKPYQAEQMETRQATQQVIRKILQTHEHLPEESQDLFLFEVAKVVAELNLKEVGRAYGVQKANEARIRKMVEDENQIKIRFPYLGDGI